MPADTEKVYHLHVKSGMRVSSGHLYLDGMARLGRTTPMEYIYLPERGLELEGVLNTVPVLPEPEKLAEGILEPVYQFTRETLRGPRSDWLVYKIIGSVPSNAKEYQVERRAVNKVVEMYEKMNEVAKKLGEEVFHPREKVIADTLKRKNQNGIISPSIDVWKWQNKLDKACEELYLKIEILRNKSI